MGLELRLGLGSGLGLGLGLGSCLGLGLGLELGLSTCCSSRRTGDRISEIAGDRISRSSVADGVEPADEGAGEERAFSLARSAATWLGLGLGLGLG